MSGLSRAGLNEFQIKYLMGKAIPLADLTYLQTLQQEIEEKYPGAYEHTLNLKTEVPVRVVSDLSKELELKTREIEVLRGKVDRIEGSREGLEALLKRVVMLEKKLKR